MALTRLLVHSLIIIEHAFVPSTFPDAEDLAKKKRDKLHSLQGANIQHEKRTSYRQKAKSMV